MAVIKKLSEILGSKQGVDLEFIDMLEEETSSGLPIVRLILKKNIPAVFGRQIQDAVSGDRVRLEANDVEMVSIGADALAAIEKIENEEIAKPEAERKMPFTWIKEGESGTIKLPTMKLEVSAALEVWVAGESFAKFGANRRNAQRQKERSSLVERLRKNKTEREFKDTNVAAETKPETVGAKN